MEAARAQQLRTLQLAGEIRWWMPHPRFDLIGDVRFAADFLVESADGGWHVEDVKGVQTAEFKLKKKLWAKTPGLYPLHVRNDRGVIEIVEAPHG